MKTRAAVLMQQPGEWEVVEADVPRLLAMYEQGQLKLDELVTTTYPLDDINVGYQDLHAGRNIRGMIEF